MTTAYAGAVVRIGAFAIPLVRLSSLVLAFAILTALHLFLTKALGAARFERLPKIGRLPP